MRRHTRLVPVALGLALCTASCSEPRPSAGSRPDAPWDEARLPDVDFRAVGQEPGWSLEIRGSRVRYVGEYGATEIVGTIAETTRGEDGVVSHHAAGKGDTLTVTVRPDPCRDSMSGEAFSHSVTVRVGGRELRGCGRRLP